jgi:curved DNA-binding protein CbpA
MKDYYELLELPRTASRDEIQAAIDGISIVYKNLLDGGLVNKMASEGLKNVRAAKKVLLNPASRDIYDKELETEGERIIKTQQVKRAFDYSSHRIDDAVGWRDLVDNPNVANVDIYRQLLRQIIVLPYPDIQENIILATLLTPTPLANMLPILFTWGHAGTGKSGLGKFAALIYGAKVIGSTTTASGMARILQEMKFSPHRIEF